MEKGISLSFGLLIHNFKEKPKESSLSPSIRKIKEIALGLQEEQPQLVNDEAIAMLVEGVDFSSAFEQIFPCFFMSIIT